jgi:hypothetical protein
MASNPYLAFPRGIPGLSPALVEGNQEPGAAVSVGEGETGLTHLVAGGLCFESAGGSGCYKILPIQPELGDLIPRGIEAASEPMVASQLAVSL